MTSGGPERTAPGDPSSTAPESSDRRPLSELYEGARVRGRIRRHFPFGLGVELIDYERVGASLDVIRRQIEPAVVAWMPQVERGELHLPPIGTVMDFMIGELRTHRMPPGVWVDLTLPDSTTMTPDTIAALRNAGWSPDRCVDVSSNVALLKSRNHTVVLAVEDFLSQMAGLTVSVSSAAPRGRPRTFHFDVADACARTPEGFVGLWETPADDYLVPVGHLATGDMALVMSSSGALFAGKGTKLYLLGRTTAEGLDTLCGPTGPAQWPRQHAPERTGPPLLLRAEPPMQVWDSAAAAARSLAYSEVNPGPVLACVDLGDVWRVYRSSHPTALHAPHVPMLVDKQTGDLFNEWPFRTDGPTAQDAFRVFLNLLGTALKPLGFVRDGQSWRRDDDNHHLVLSVTRYRTLTTRLCCTFYLTPTVVPRKAWQQQRAQDPSLPELPPPVHGTGLRIEFGRHEGQQARFHVLAGVDPTWMTICVLDALSEQPAMPAWLTELAQGLES